MKKYFQTVQAYAASPSAETMTEIQSAMSMAYSKIDKAVKRKVLHTNNGARKKARLMRALKKTLATTTT